MIRKAGISRLRFGQDRRGNFALIGALVMIPLTMAVGAMIDLGRAANYDAKLRDAADSAVLAALAPNSLTATAAHTMTGIGEIESGEAVARAFFAANFEASDDVTITKLEMTVLKEDQRLYAKVDYTAEVDLMFAAFLPKQTITLSGSVDAQMPLDQAVDFYMLLDNSPSMGVAATSDDIDTMVQNTSNDCAFACHDLSNNNNYYKLAKQLGVSMRIDVVREATQNLTATALSTRTWDDQFRMAVFSFGAKAEEMGLTKVADLSSNMQQVKAATQSVDLMTTPKQNYNSDQQTDFDSTLAALNAVIADPGSGFGDDEPQKIIFLVTDGVADAKKPSTCTKKTTGSRCQEPIDVKTCTAIKQRGIKIAALYTTYLPLPTNSWYSTWIAPFQSEIGPRLEECASPGLYFEVGMNDGISDAMEALFQRTISRLRLLQ
ncbi:TadE/TadG family type IV pilus assembly protein [Consotaella aegiceratis]|uniref:TadE/TadG family type IV pilus assembly protein n=1 Tax=Consotaella aegiceratis TaxID=3097961 RepID=UPI002F3FCE52